VLLLLGFCGSRLAFARSTIPPAPGPSAVLNFTISGAPARLQLASNYSATSPTPNKLVIFVHYYGGTVNSEPPTGFKDSLVNNGYSVATLSAGNSWGNETAQMLYIQLYQYVEQNYNFQGAVYLISDSMGTLCSLNLLDAKSMDVRSYVGICPVVALNNYYDYEYNLKDSSYPTIQTAYNFQPGVANVQQATIGYDPYQRITINGADTVYNSNNIPTYFIQGKLDPYIAWARTMAHASANQALVEVPAIGHDTLVLNAARISTILTWMAGAGSSVPNSNLANLTISNGTLTPSFKTTTTSYTAFVNYETTSVQLTPTTSDATATVKINGAAVISGSTSGVIALKVGSNIITTVVTSHDGTATSTYTITITRSGLNNAYLSSLMVSAGGTLSPAFSMGTNSYAASTPASMVTITPTASDPSATLKVNNTAVSSGSASAPLVLNLGVNAITIAVTSPDGTTNNTYTINITHFAPSTNAALAGLSVGAGVLSPAFATTKTSYTVLVSNAHPTITLTPTAADATATIQINGKTVISGSPSTALPLAVGANTITTIVKAQDSTTTKSYIVTITRLPSTNAGLANLTLSGCTLSPSFATATTAYTTTVNTAFTTVTPLSSDATATIKVNGTTVASGTSATVPLNIGTNTITTVVTAQDGATTKTYTVTVTRTVSSNATLAKLAVSAGNLTPAFASTKTSYTVLVSNAHPTIMLTSITSDSTATIQVNGKLVKSGVPSSALPLAVGANIISTGVTAQDGTTTNTYTVTITRLPSTNAALTSLNVNGCMLNPAFNTATYTYSSGTAAASVTVTPLTSDATATVKINGSIVASGTASASIPLAVGPNTINTIVTAQDGTTIKTYTVNITRTGTSNAALAGLTISSGVLSPVFTRSTTNYTASVIVPSITLTPATSDAYATVTVNGTAVTSGTASAPIALNLGSNTVTAVVTAPDGTTTNTYVITITRSVPSSNASLSLLTVSAGNLTPAFTTTKTSYTVLVSNFHPTISITPTAADATAIILVNGVAVASGSASQTLNLAVGANIITTVVTAQDGVTTKTYTVTITREPSSTATAEAGNTIVFQRGGPLRVIVDDNLVVHTAVSPNGDGLNDFLAIDNITMYPENKLSVMNINGALIFEVKGYDNYLKVFDGRNNKGIMQKPGTYFYSLEYKAGAEIRYKTGFIVLKY